MDRKLLSLTLTMAMLAGYVVMAPSASAEDVTVPDTATVWDFSAYADTAAVTAAEKQTVPYTVDGMTMDMHLASGDTVTDSGLKWSAPCGTASDSTDVAGNNRYIKFTPEYAGTITVNFSGSLYANNKKPRMYVVEGDAETVSFSKNGSTISADAAAANSATNLSTALEAGKTYYIWPFCYNQSGCAFTVSKISYLQTPTVYRAANLRDATDPTFGSLEIHLGGGDSLTSANGIYWKEPSIIKSNTAISNNRYIKYTAPADCTMDITFRASGETAKSPRLYAFECEALSDVKKDSGTANVMQPATAANIDTVLSVNMTQGKTYYIASFYNNLTTCSYTISNIEITAAFTTTFGSDKVLAKSGSYITVPAPAGETGKTITGWKDGSTYYYPGDSVLIDEIAGKTITEVEYNTTDPVAFVNDPDTESRARYKSVILGETVGLTSGTTNNTYEYSDNNLAVTVKTSAGDIITADNGIKFKSASIGGDSADISAVGKGGRYILVKPAIDGTFGITGECTITGNNVGRMYYKDLGTDAVSDETINAIAKSSGTALKDSASGGGSFGTNTISMTADHTYIIYFWTHANYNSAEFDVIKMTYNATDAKPQPTASPRPDPELRYLPEFNISVVDGSLVTSEEDDGSKASGFFVTVNATHGGTLTKLGLIVGDTDKGVRKPETSVTLADSAEVSFGVILDGIIAESTADIEMTANESSLAGKTVYAFGDSIVYGHNAPEKAFMNILAANEDMTLKKYAQNGATIIERGSKQIINQVRNAPSEEPDFVVFEGYTNDAQPDTLKMGTMKGKNATETDFDTTTFCGAFEHLIYTMKQKWPDANYVFVTIHKSSGRDWNTQYDLRDKSIEICNEWGISVADIFGYTTLDTRDPAQLKKYIINGAGSHPNEAANKEFYVPVITAIMKAFD